MKKTSWPRTRYPSFRKRLVIRPNRGILVAQSWPKKRTGPRHPTNAYWSDWLSQADTLWKYQPDVFVRAALSAARGTPQMPRDLFISAIRGRLFMLTLDTGRRMFPMCAVRDVSQSLDVLSQDKGSILYRDDNIWKPLGPGQDGQAITWSAALGRPTWGPPTPGGDVYTPPNIADFPLLIGTPPPTLEKAFTGPLVLGRAAAGIGTNLSAALHTLTAPPHRYTIGLFHIAELITNNMWGMVLYDSATARCVAFVYRMLTPTSAPRLSIDTWNTPISYQTTVVFKVVTHQNALFLRIQDDGTNFLFQISADDANWKTAATVGRTAWLANPSHAGFGVISGGAESIGSALAAFHYHHEAY